MENKNLYKSLYMSSINIKNTIRIRNDAYYTYLNAVGQQQPCLSFGLHDIYCICLDVMNCTCYFIEDERFVKKVSSDEIKKTGYNGLFFNENDKSVGYCITLPNGEIKILVYFDDNDVKNVEDFINMFKKFNEIIINNKYENYSIHDLLYDKFERLITKEEGKGLTKVITIGNNHTSKGHDAIDGLYFYENTGTVVARSNYTTQIVRNVSFSNADDFTAFAKEVAEVCAEKNPYYFMEEYIKGGIILRDYLYFQCTKLILFTAKYGTAWKDYLKFLEKKKGALDGAQKDISAVKKESKSASEVKMNGKPNHDKEPKADDTGTVGKMLNKLENDKQLDKLANNKGNNGRE